MTLDRYLELSTLQRTILLNEIDYVLYIIDKQYEQAKAK